MTTEYVTVEQAARVLGLTLTDTARMIVSGELKVNAPAGVPLDDVSIRVHGPWLREVAKNRAAFCMSSVDRAEANRIFGRKYSLRGWPPVSWSPGRKDVAPVVDAGDDIVNVVDHPAIVLDWLAEREQYESRLVDMADSLCVLTRKMTRPEFDLAVYELERLKVLQVVKLVTGARGPRPKGVRLYLWFYDAVRAGRRPSISEVRARAEE